MAVHQSAKDELTRHDAAQRLRARVRERCMQQIRADRAQKRSACIAQLRASTWLHEAVHEAQMEMSEEVRHTDSRQDIGRILQEEYKRAQAHFEAQLAAEVGELDLDHMLDIEDAITREQAALHNT